MSTPICSRCQKIYAAAEAPAKCVNCGGDVRVPIPQPRSENLVNRAGDSLQEGNLVNRKCWRADCQSLATYSIKYFYTGKKIVMAPAPAHQDKDAQDLCPIHAVEFKAPPGWNFSQARRLPSLLDGPGGTGRTNSSYNQTSTASSGGDGCFTFIAGLIGFVIVVVIGAAVVIFLMDFFSGMDTGNIRPVRVPFKWRR